MISLVPDNELQVQKSYDVLKEDDLNVCCYVLSEYVWALYMPAILTEMSLQVTNGV